MLTPALRTSAIALICVVLASCASVRERTDSFLFADPAQLNHPVDAWLRTITIISDQIPLSAEYPIIEQSYTALASRYGFRLSTTNNGQQFVVDLSIQAQTFTADLTTKDSVIAVLDLQTSDSKSAARVVYTAIAPNSIQSLYSLYDIGETLFSTLRSAIAADAKHRRSSGTLALPPATGA